MTPVPITYWSTTTPPRVIPQDEASHGAFKGWRSLYGLFVNFSSCAGCFWPFVAAFLPSSSYPCLPFPLPISSTYPHIERDSSRNVGSLIASLHQRRPSPETSLNVFPWSADPASMFLLHSRVSHVPVCAWPLNSAKTNFRIACVFVHSISECGFRLL